MDRHTQVPTCTFPATAILLTLSGHEVVPCPLACLLRPLSGGLTSSTSLSHRSTHNSKSEGDHESCKVVKEEGRGASERWRRYAAGVMEWYRGIAIGSLGELIESYQRDAGRTARKLNDWHTGKGVIAYHLLTATLVLIIHFAGLLNWFKVFSKYRVSLFDLHY